MFQTPPLPYGYDALGPAMSEVTLRTHHDKHHAGYVKTVNDKLAPVARPPATLEEVIAEAGVGDALFNAAAQAWNHGFFWQCMTPDFQPPGGDLAVAIDANFGGLEALKEKFIAEGKGHFGSGWVWLVIANEKLSVVSTHDAETEGRKSGVTPILVCDVWEHAYYLDHKNDRAAYLEAWWDRLANWAFAQTQFAAAQGAGGRWRYPPAQG